MRISGFAVSTCLILTFPSLKGQDITSEISQNSGVAHTARHFLNDQVRSYLNSKITTLPFLALQVGPSINGTITSVPNGTLESGIFGNISLLGFEKKKFGFCMDAKHLFLESEPKSNLLGIGGFYRINKRNVLGFGFRYVNMGELILRDAVGRLIPPVTPYDLAASVSYTISLDAVTSIGVAAKFIHSAPWYALGSYKDHMQTHIGNALAGDLGFSRKFVMKDDRLSHMLGISLNNIGPKISYGGNYNNQFLPTSLAIGYSFKMNFYRVSISASYQASKFLIPSYPLYYKDSLDANDDLVIRTGNDPNVSAPLGMIRSFYDTPFGFQAKLNEIAHSFGINANLYNVCLGIGYFYEKIPNVDAIIGEKLIFSSHKFVSFGIGYNLRDIIRLNCSTGLVSPIEGGRLQFYSFSVGVNAIF